MSKLKPYLNDFKNKDEIEEIAKRIVNIELEIDKLKSRKQILNDHISKTKNKSDELEKKTLKYPKDDEIKLELNNKDRTKRPS